MDKDEISPIALILTLLYHFGLLYLALKGLPHHHTPHSPFEVIHVSIPVNPNFHPQPSDTIDVKDLVIPARDLIEPPENPEPLESERYYLPQELSQQVHVLEDDTARLNIPIRQIVTMTLYINESGSVDDVTIDNAGVLTDDEKDQLIAAFRHLLFIPGMRGAKIVKSQFRIQLEINRRVIFHR